MDTFRLILICVGVVLILGIYLWGRLGQRKKRQPGARQSDRPAPQRLAETTPEPVSEPPTAEPEAPTILALHLIAPADEPIDGQRLFQAAAISGLEFGDMDIFHCRVEDEPEPIFSMANMVKPGTFDLSELATFTTPGAVMFLQLPGPDAPMAAFDHMLAVAQQLSEFLGVPLFDGRRQPLVDEEVQAMRERVKPYC